MPLYLAFLPVGFTMPPRSLGKRWALTLIRLRQTHLFTLTLKYRAVYFLWHFPWDHSHSVLRSTVSYGARTFLSMSIVGKLGLSEMERPSHLLLNWYSSLRKSIRLQFGQRTNSLPPMSKFRVCNVMFIKQPPQTLSTTSTIAFPPFLFDNRL